MTTIFQVMWLSLMSQQELPSELQLVDLRSSEVFFFFLRRFARGACSTACKANPSLAALWKALYAAFRALST